MASKHKYSDSRIAILAVIIEIRSINQRLSTWISQQWFSMFILFISLVITFSFTLTTLYLAKIKEEARFESSVSRTQRTIETRLDTYVTILKAEAGLFVASDEVTAREFYLYTKQLELEKPDTGIHAVGYISAVTPENQIQVQDKIRQVHPDFSFSDRPNNTPFTAVTYLEPNSLTHQQTIGTDMSQEPIYKEAMNQATKTGSPVLSGKIRFPLSENMHQTGFLLFIPIPSSQDLSAADTKPQDSEPLGYLFGVLVAENLFGEILQDFPHSDIDFWIYDGVVPSPENSLYTSNNSDISGYSKTLPHYSATSTITTAGRHLTVLYITNHNFNYSLERSTYPYYLVVGLVISFLVFALSRLHSKSVISSAKAHAELLSSQEALRRSSIQYKTLAENASDLVTVVDALGTILYASPSHEDLFGITPDELVGTSILPYIHPDDFEKLQEKLTSMAEGGHEQAIFRVQRQGDGAYTSLEGVGTGLIDEHGNVNGILIISRDITEREAIDRRKDEFISIASHELKTPVTSLKVYTQYLQQYFANKEDRVSVELLNKMDRQLLKLTRLIRDLLDVSRIESGKLDLNLTSFDVKTVISEVLETLALMQPKHQVHLEKITKTKITADRDRIAQVITNLVANAMKYSSEQQPIIISQKKTKNTITLCVQDFGTGIPRSKQKQIFERFFRVDGPKQETFAGFGLGLYIAREIIEKHHGKIWVKSQVGKGSTFCITIPLQTKNTLTST